MIIVRTAKEIYQAEGEIRDGTFKGRWHFSFDQYYDPEYIHFGNLRVFNDDILSPGAIWPFNFLTKLTIFAVMVILKLQYL